MNLSKMTLNLQIFISINPKCQFLLFLNYFIYHYYIFLKKISSHNFKMLQLPSHQDDFVHKILTSENKWGYLFFISDSVSQVRFDHVVCFHLTSTKLTILLLSFLAFLSMMTLGSLIIVSSHPLEFLQQGRVPPYRRVISSNSTHGTQHVLILICLATRGGKLAFQYAPTYSTVQYIAILLGKSSTLLSCHFYEYYQV